MKVPSCMSPRTLLRAVSVRRRSALVERFDIEPYSDFSAKLSNFRGLVLLCIDAKFCRDFHIQPVQRNANLVDLEKC